MVEKTLPMEDLLCHLKDGSLLEMFATGTAVSVLLLEVSFTRVRGIRYQLIRMEWLPGS